MFGALMEENDVQVSLEHQVQRISLEFAVVDNMVKHLAEVVPSLTTRITEAVKSTFVPNHDKSNADLDVSFTKLKGRLDHMGISQFDRVLVSIPEGFKGDFLEYLLTLNTIAPAVYKNAMELLTDYHSVLAAFITNKDNKIALQDHTQILKTAKQAREAIQKQMDSFFKPTTVSKARFTDVVNRISDLQKIQDQAKLLEKAQKSNSIEAILQETNKVASLLTIIHENLMSGEVDRVSGAATKNIAEGAMEVGRYIEVVSVYAFRVQQILTNVSGLYDQIDRMID